MRQAREIIRLKFAAAVTTREIAAHPIRELDDRVQPA
jgi:hypothetical protein